MMKQQTSHHESRLSISSRLGLITTVTLFLLLHGISSAQVWKRYLEQPHVANSRADVLSMTNATQLVLNTAIDSDVLKKLDNTLQANPDDARWDSQFGVNAIENIQINAIAVKGDTIYVGGYFNSFLGITANSLMMWDGNAWSALGSGEFTGIRSGGGGPGTVLSLAITTNGDLLIGGLFSESASSVVSPSIIRWNGSGFVAVGSGITNGSVNAIAVHPTNGSIYVGGTFSIAGVNGAINIAEWKNNSWNALSSGIAQSNVVNALAIRGTSLYVAGRFSQVGSVAAEAIALWNISTSTWSALGDGLILTGGIKANVYSIDIATNGDLVAGGDFDRSGSKTVRNIARWNGTTWDEIGGGSDGLVTALYLDGSKIYVAGLFDKLGGENFINFAAWNGLRWEDQAGDQLNTNPRSIAKFGNNLLVGGNFAIEVSPVFSIRGLAISTGTTWLSLGGTRGNGVDGPIGSIVAMSNQSIIATGAFQKPGGIDSRAMAIFNGQNWLPVAEVGFANNAQYATIAQRNDSLFLATSLNRTDATGHRIGLFNPETGAFTSLGTTNGGFQRRINSIVTTSNSIIVGGLMTNIAGANNDSSTSRNVALYDGSVWRSMGDGLILSSSDASSVSALAVAPNGDIYAAGSFDISGTTVLPGGIARWDGTSWKPLGQGITNSLSSQPAQVTTMTIIGDRLYVGGVFNGAGGVAVSNFAAWNMATNQWEAINNARFNNAVLRLSEQQGVLTITGRFDSVGTIAANRVVQYNPLTSSFSPLGSGINGEVLAMAATTTGIYFGGSISTAGGKGSQNIARWLPGTTSVDNAWNDQISSTMTTASPNPATSDVVFTFTVPTSGNALVEVYSATGHLQDVLCQSRFLESGQHRFDWSAKHVSPGVYYARMTIQGISRMQRVVVIR